MSHSSAILIVIWQGCKTAINSQVVDKTSIEECVVICDDGDGNLIGYAINC